MMATVEPKEQDENSDYWTSESNFLSSKSVLKVRGGDAKHSKNQRIEHHTVENIWKSEIRQIRVTILGQRKLSDLWRKLIQALGEQWSSYFPCLRQDQKVS
jgi:hypothetical protein